MTVSIQIKGKWLLKIVLAGIVLNSACQPVATPLPEVMPPSTVTHTAVIPSPTKPPTSTPIPIRTPLPFPSNVTIVLDGNEIDPSTVKDPNLRIIQRAITVASNEVTTRGYDIEPVIVYLASNPDSFVSLYMESHRNSGFPISKSQALQDFNNGLTGEAGGGSLVLYIGGENWQRPVADRYTQIAHEFFHTIQYGLADKSGYGDNSKPGPIWLLEGSASYFASAIVCKYGLTNTWYGWDWKSADQMFPTVKLSDTVQRGYGDESPYVLGIAATAKLVSDLGDDRIYEYFVLNKNMRWQDAFQEAFGRSVDEFYQEFETQRADLKNIPYPRCNSN